MTGPSLELTDAMRAKLLVSVTGEDAAFIKRVVKENERLRKDVARMSTENRFYNDAIAAQDALVAENERLREDCRHAEDAFLGVEKKRDEAVAQYEQQQAFRHQDDRELTRLREENERLRARYEARVASQAASDREVERLREELEQTAQLADRLAKGYNDNYDRLRRIEEAANRVANAAYPDMRELRAALADQPAEEKA